MYIAVKRDSADDKNLGVHVDFTGNTEHVRIKNLSLPLLL